MPYIGRDTDKISNVEKLDTLTFDGSSSYTLQKNSVNFVPSSANTLLISIDGVMQYGNFTISGSTIDFGVAIASSSTCDFVLHIGVGIITAPSDGSVTTAKLGDTSVTTAKLADDSVTKDKTSALMYPAFEAYLGSSQTFSDATTVKVNFNTEIFDSNSCYDASTNYRFTPTVAGKYFIYSTIAFDGRSNSNLNIIQLNIYKNGSIYKENQSYFISNYIRQLSGSTNAIIDMNGSSDYIEIYAYVDMISASNDARLFGGSNKNSNFGAYRLGD